MRVTADDLDAVITCVDDSLRPAVDRNWTVRAGTLDWTCWSTAEHLGQCLAHYASQLAIRARTRYVRWAAGAMNDAPPDGVLDFVTATGRILAMVVRASPPQVRTYHPYGMADPAASAGGGCVEALVHAHDIATGLGVDFAPPPDVCGRVVARMFPHHESRLAQADVDPWTALRWLTGRVDAPGLPELSVWRWRSTPLNEPWIIAPPAPRAF
ncbi:hypothetical protein ABN028_21695 [Actinopolymorpha sp. B17G11]|uniref:hypothetical protein n=1 Tax=unclassified Actinopolymorpha TaxID=2627063 RepID=UPI0032D8C82B